MHPKIYGSKARNPCIRQRHLICDICIQRYMAPRPGTHASGNGTSSVTYTSKDIYGSKARNPCIRQRHLICDICIQRYMAPRPGTHASGNGSHNTHQCRCITTSTGSGMPMHHNCCASEQAAALTNMHLIIHFTLSDILVIFLHSELYD